MVWFTIFLVFILVMGPYGIISIFLSLIFYASLKWKEKRNKSMKKEIFEMKNLKYNKQDELNNFSKLNINEHEQIISYTDILNGFNDKLKVELIGSLVFNVTKENVNFIRQALKDQNESIRILASNSLQKMEDRFESKIKDFSYKLEHYDPFSYNEKNKDELTVELIKVYDNYLYSGLIEDELKSSYIKIILNLFKSLNIEDTTDHNIIKLYIRYLIRYNFLDRALQIIYMKEHLFDKNSEIYFWLAEIYYKQNSMRKLREVISEIDINNIHFKKLKESLTFWKGNFNE